MNEIHIKSDAKYIDIHHNDVVNVDISTKEPASEDLDEAANDYADKHGFRVPYDGTNNFYDDVDVKASKEGFIAGANWQKQQLYTQAEQHLSKKTNGEITLEDTVAFNEGLKIGKQLMEKQMMKDAKEGIVTDKGDFIKFMDGTWVDLDPTVGNTPAFSLKEGQNVKLIVIKEE